MKRRFEYAPAGTLTGLVQRGRGLGARMAAEDPAAAAGLVYGCVRWDWRWDAADQRALYLARLLRDLALPPEPVAALRDAGDEATRARAAAVLAALDGGPVPVEPVPAEPAAGAHGGLHDGLYDGAARAGDLPGLLAELERAWVEQRWCGPAEVARGLARFGAQARGGVSLLRRFWLWTPHSSERAAYLEALAAIDPAGLAETHVECLWDCEEGARALGAAQAPDRPEVRERLAYLRDDPAEAPGVRAAAGERLAALTS